MASGSVLCYGEVKASRDAAKQVFELSERELSFAATEGDRYHVLRIRGIGGSAPTLERLIKGAHYGGTGCATIVAPACCLQHGYVATPDTSEVEVWGTNVSNCVAC